MYIYIYIYVIPRYMYVGRQAFRQPTFQDREDLGRVIGESFQQPTFHRLSRSKENT